MPETIEQIRAKLDKPQLRTVTIGRDTVIDEANRTVTLAFASDNPCETWFGDLVLSMGKKNVRTDRLDAGLALLLDHDRTKQIGIVESFDFGNDGIARAVVKFSRGECGDECFQDVKDGIRKSVSVGFMIHELHLEKQQDNENDLYRSDDWEPIEISLVSIPADISVGVGRSKETPVGENNKLNFTIDVNVTNPETNRAHSAKTEKTMPETERIETPETPVVESQRSATADVVTRTKEIVEFAEIFGQGDLARQMIAASPAVTIDDVRTAIQSKQTAPAAVPTRNPADQARDEGGVIQLARSLPRYGTLKNFTGDNGAERAYRFGQWFLAARGVKAAMEFCSTNGIALTRAMSEGVNESGGFLVPEEFGNDLIDLREIYGVFRRNAKMVAMASDTRSDPRRDGGLTAYFEGEGDAGTTSDMAWGRVSLTAKKLMVLARYSTEVNEDSVINFGDILAGEIAYAFALKEDQCGFIGDGTSTYGGMQGVTTKIKGLSGTIANIAGLVVATGTGYGTNYASAVLADFEAVVGKLPIYADTPRARWFMHKSFYWNVAKKLELASGGVTAAEVGEGGSPKFLGYPVELTQVLPKTSATSQVCALLGDLSLAASFGSRRDTTIAISEHSRFANDQLEIRGTERFDINVHDVGNASATAGLRVEGPVVGLITAAS
jgi:HK97 family phage major capsid protein